MTGMSMRKVTVASLLLLVGASIAAATVDRSRTVETAKISQKGKADLYARAYAATSVGIPREDVDIIIARGMKRGGDAAEIGRFLDLCVNVKKQDLPVGPVLDRIVQGLSKRTPMIQINTASQRLAEKETMALPVVDAFLKQGMQGGKNNEREKAIEAVARTFEQSVSRDSIAEIGSAVQKRQGSLSFFTDAVNSVTYLAAKGIPGEKASKMIANAVSSGASEKDLDALVRQTKQPENDQNRWPDVDAAYDGHL